MPQAYWSAEDGGEDDLGLVFDLEEVCFGSSEESELCLDFEDDVFLPVEVWCSDLSSLVLCLCSDEVPLSDEEGCSDLSSSLAVCLCFVEVPLPDDVWCSDLSSSVAVCLCFVEVPLVEEVWCSGSSLLAACLCFVVPLLAVDV